MDALSRKLLEAYDDNTRPVGYWLGLTTPVYHNNEKVAWDVTRSGKLVAPAIDYGTTNLTDSDLWTAKEQSPFYYNQEGVLNGFQLLGREPGQSGLADQNVQNKAKVKAVTLGLKNFDSVLRAAELQAMQIFTTGTITAKGVTLSFAPKATHFPQVTTSWSDPAAPMLDDIEALCDVILTDGKKMPEEIVFSSEDWKALLNNTQFKERQANRGIQITQINRNQDRNGAKYHGTLEVGDYNLDMITYNDTYQLVEEGAYLKYVPSNRTIIHSRARINSTFGGIPRVVTKDSRLAFIPDRLTVPGKFLDMSIFPSVNQNGTAVSIEVGTRALVVPVAIDTFGCFNTVAA